MKKIISTILIFLLSQQLFSCGYLVHSERRGQNGGKVDWAIAALDAIGLLFFIIPGLIAFAVDIGTGTIYLPNTDRHASFDLKDAKKIKIEGQITEAKIRAAIKKETGVTLDLKDPRLEIYRQGENSNQQNS